MSLYIDVHALHTLPPSNINRDDTGSPKTATFGGVPRQRVSSQAWKRAIRRDFANYLPQDALGTRTKRVIDKIVERVREIEPNFDSEEAASRAEAVLTAAGIKTKPRTIKKLDEDDVDAKQPFNEVGYLLFVSSHQLDNVANYIINSDGSKPKKKDVPDLLDKHHSVDIAMFGRMVADSADFNVDAAVQVSHALGVSASEPEFDYFTAVDDVAADAEETGAGMIGTVQMMSSTLYRYATVNFAQLESNLDSREAAIQAVQAFVQAFITSMPTGKQNTFANRTLPEAVIVSIRTDRPISWVNAFENPVVERPGMSRRLLAAEQLADEGLSIDAIYDTKPLISWVIALPSLTPALESLGKATTRSTLLSELKESLTSQENE